MGKLRSLVTISLVTSGLLAACDPVDPTFVDAGPGTDATPDASIGPATITVLADEQEVTPGEPVQNARVFFIRPDRSYEMKTTGADGKASADVVPGSTIIAVSPQTLRGVASSYLSAFAGIGPGMEVVAGDKRRPSTTASTRPVTVSWTAPGGATGYSVFVTCGTYNLNGTTATITPFSDCPGASNATVMVTARNADFVDFAYSSITGLDLVGMAGSTQTLPAFSTTYATASATYSNLPATLQSASVRIRLLDGETELGQFNGSSQIMGTSVSMSGPIPPVGSSTFVQSRFFGNRTMVGQVLPVFHVRRTSGQQLTPTLDVGANLIPFTLFPSFDPASLTASWTTVGGAPGRSTDVVVARGYYQVARTSTGVRWTFAGPATLRSISLGALPPELADFVPAATDQGGVNDFWLIDVVGKDFPAVIKDAMPESRDLWSGSGSFPGEQELWFTGSIPQ